MIIQFMNVAQTLNKYCFSWQLMGWGFESPVKWRRTIRWAAPDISKGRVDFVFKGGQSILDISGSLPLKTNALQFFQTLGTTHWTTKCFNIILGNWTIYLLCLEHDGTSICTAAFWPIVEKVGNMQQHSKNCHDLNKCQFSTFIFINNKCAGIESALKISRQ